MDYFYDIEFKKGVITVLGAEKESSFVSALKEKLEGMGSTCVTDDKDAIVNTDYLIIAPDKNVNKKFIVHTENDIATFKKKGIIIGVVSIEALLKDISCSVVGTDDFCDITDMEKGDLVYPLALAKVIKERERFDWLYIDDISNSDRRFTARETNRHIKYGAGVRIINTDTNYVEQLLAPSQEQNK